MPSIGRLTDYQPPAETNTVRVDTGVYEGGEISMHYDPMIAKLVTYGDTREAAIGEMVNALDDYLIRGVSHNIPFLASVIQQPDLSAVTCLLDLSTNITRMDFRRTANNATSTIIWWHLRVVCNTK